MSAVAEKRDNLRSAASMAFGLRVSGTVVRFGIQVALSRLLGVSAFGQFVLIRGWSELVAKLPNAGSELGVMRTLPALCTNGRWAEARTEMTVAGRSTILRALALATVLGGVLIAAGRFDSTGILVLGLLTVITASQFFRSLQHALGDYLKALTATELLQPIIFGLAVGALWLTDRLTAVSVATALLASFAFTALIQARSAQRCLPIDDTSSDSGGWLSWPKEHRYLYLIQLSIALMNQSGVLVLGMTTGAVEAALLAVAIRVAALGQLATSSIEALAAPELAALRNLDGAIRAERAQVLVDRSILMAIPPSIAFAVAGALFASPILSVFGAEYAAAKWAFLFILMANAIEGLSGPAGYLLSSIGRVDVYAKGLLAHAGGLVLVGFGAAHLWGLEGMAAVMALGLVSSHVWVMQEVQRSLSIRCYPRPGMHR